jgi:hypothetical protein
MLNKLSAFRDSSEKFNYVIYNPHSEVNYDKAVEYITTFIHEFLWIDIRKFEFKEGAMLKNYIDQNLTQ